MGSSVHSLRLAAGISGAALALCLAGCGGATGYTQIFIDSPSETALVNFVCLPGGVQEKYSASDTSPSGDLTFTGSDTASPGSYKVLVMVSSAGQTASTGFTMVVSAASS